MMSAEMFGKYVHKMEKTIMNIMDCTNFTTDDMLTIVREETPATFDHDDYKTSVMSPMLSPDSYRSSSNYAMCPVNYASDTETGGVNFVEDLLQDKDLMNTDAVKRLKENDMTMKQYLQLTASAVKIKYPHITINTEDLTRRVGKCSFYQYHDRMVSIMEMEKKRTEIKDMTTCERLLYQKKSHLINKSIANLKKIQSVTKTREKWKALEKENSSQSLRVKRKKRSPKNERIKSKGKSSNNNTDTDKVNNMASLAVHQMGDSNIYNTFVFRGSLEDLKQQSNSYGIEEI